jgi:hypothetical protein
MAFILDLLNPFSPAGEGAQAVFGFRFYIIRFHLQSTLYIKVNEETETLKESFEVLS